MFKLFRFNSFGESHGPAIGCIIEGVPPLMALSESDLQVFLDRRRPGSSKFTTQRNEKDQAKILSGVFDGKTTGTPIGILIENEDQKSRDYGEIAHTYRPGHADYVYQTKYGMRDYRGGGRSSARETAMRVAVGAVAHRMLSHELGKDFAIVGSLVKMGGIHINRDNFDQNTINDNPFFCGDPTSVQKFEDKLVETRKNGNSIGGIVEVIVKGIPCGLGEPVYDKLDADLAKALMSINAVKAVEIGEGMASADLTGYENNDQMVLDSHGEPSFLSNHAGGIIGGISTGQDIIVRIALKPTPSILQEQKSLTHDKSEVNMATKGRHDPCVAIRGVPVAEAMVAIVLADHLLRFKAYNK